MYKDARTIAQRQSYKSQESRDTSSELFCEHPTMRFQNAPLRTTHDGRVLIVCTPKLNALFSGKDSFLTTILYNGNPTTATTTRIHK